MLMKATGEVQVIPLGAGSSVRKEVKRAHAILAESGLTVQLHANGTNVEGEMSWLFHAIEKVHETLHAEGTVRLVTYLKIATRTDKVPTLDGKLF
jgi:uncharacterized protein (TIGR00106 family)